MKVCKVNVENTPSNFLAYSVTTFKNLPLEVG